MFSRILQVLPGSRKTDDASYCHYCRKPSDDFRTEEQTRYATDIVEEEALKTLESVIRDALGVGPSGKMKLGGGPISMELSYKTGVRSPVRRPFEDQVRRDVACPSCGRDQTVFGLAMWCAECGKNIFMSHVVRELCVIKSMVDDIPRREEQLGKRVAAKDLENALEDIVSIFEASVKALVRQALVERGYSNDDLGKEFRSIANAFQSIERTKGTLSELFALDLGIGDIWQKLAKAFEKRHPVAHNLGIIDRKYLRKAQETEGEGREIRISLEEIKDLISLVDSAIGAIHSGLVKS
jgi:hypothetical protein